MLEEQLHTAFRIQLSVRNVEERIEGTRLPEIGIHVQDSHRAEFLFVPEGDVGQNGRQIKAGTFEIQLLSGV